MGNVTNLQDRQDMRTIAQNQQRLTAVIDEIFADRPSIDRTLAIGAGHRALERGTPFFDAVEIAEGVLNLWREVVHDTRMALIDRRNIERLTAYRIKRTGFNLFQVAVKHARRISIGEKQ